MEAARNCRLLAAAIAMAIAKPASVWAQEAPADVPPPAARIAVSTVKVEGNTLLPEDRLTALVAPLAGPERTIEDIRRTAAAVQQAYRDAGYGGVVAYVPPQRVAEGVVVIRVVEGKLAQVKVTGTERYDPVAIRNSLPSLREGDTPRVRALDRDIQLANENPGREVRVKLAPGEKAGEVDANVEVVEKPPVRFLFGVDNTGEPSTGEYRVTLGLQHLNLWGLDHVGTAQFQTSPTEPDQVQIYALGYRAPLYGYAASIDAYVGHSSVDTGTAATVAGPLQFTGKGDVFGLRANRHLDRLGEYEQQLTLGIDGRSYDNECAVGVFGEAGCGPSGVDIDLLPISLGYSGEVQTPTRSWGFSASIAQNLGGSSERTFEAARTGAPKHYTLLRLSASGGLEFPEGWGLRGRLSAQYSPDALVPGEQFGLGGADSVRGYYERELAGDYGFSATLEGLGPVLRYTLAGEEASLRPLVFADYGRIANHEDAPCLDDDTACTLSSLGVGTRLSLGKRATARLDVAYALEDGSRKEADSFRGHVAVQLGF
jgi:hemolysin activation/secretion protein